MGWMPREVPRCPACKTPVYPAEHVMAADRKPYHRFCVKCVVCRISLNPRTLNEHNEQLYCNNCYTANFNPQEFSMYGYGGNITEEDRMRAEQERRDREARLLAEQQARLMQTTSAEGENGDFVFSQLKVEELMKIAPANQIVPMGL